MIGTMKNGWITLVMLSALTVHAQVANLTIGEIEKRNAAASFAMFREAGLFLLLGECAHLMSNSNPPMDVIARGWFDRNRREMEAARAWLDQYLSYLKATNPEAHRRASMDLARAQANASLNNARINFGRKQPDRAGCEKVAKTYDIVQLDLKRMALNPGFEQFAEFSETLERIRAEPGFVVPPHLKSGMDLMSQQMNGLGNLASWDAAEAAKERGDGPGRIAILQSIAEHGDGRAAQQIGIIYLNAHQVAQDSMAAYRWFYAAWSLSDMEGLNALGVMNRDGLGVPVNLRLAAAAFYLAKTGVRTEEARARVSRNLSGLDGKVSEEERSQIACLSLSALDEALRMPVRGHEPLVTARPISDSHRQLGSFIEELAESYKASKCELRRSF